MARTFFEQIVAPLAPSAFLAKYWERQPVHVRAEQCRTTKLDALGLDMPTLKAAAARIAQVAEVTAYGMPALRATDDRAAYTVSRPIRADEIDSAYAGGMTVTLIGLQFLHPRLALIATRLRRELAHAGNIMMQAFLSPDHHGTPMHFDRSSVISVQLEGTKRWKFSKRRAMDTPPDQATVKELARFESTYPWATLVPVDDLEECVLHSGDVLYLPAGTWHEAFAEGHSFGLSIGFDRMPLHTLVARRLEELLVRQTAWRRTPQPLLDDGRIASKLGRLVDEHAQRLHELRKAVASLTAEDLVGCAYPEHLSVETLDDDVPIIAPSSNGSPKKTLRRDDRLTAPHPLAWTPGTDSAGNYALIVSSPVASASLDLEALAFVEKLTQTASFEAGAAMAWCVDPGRVRWAETRTLLEALIALGLLRRN